ncbi:YqaJ viral recombinase family protein [Pseudohongiella sp. O18]|uniref:YqaJ viral recombinase family protein n=1 Tax=Pseudohongiella sp. O18 TaxID=2904248 RepID=UPI001F26912F|nr:YqaJ viral recombinase family protein [Pseudohongiella sp. O18]
MKHTNLIQGSEEWLANRRQRFNASEAPVMMAASSKMRRNELLAAKAGYGDREYSDFVQRLFDKGHETEAQARSLLEEDIGEELYPVSGVSDCGRYAASYDGLTMLENIGFEHKLWNEQLAEAVRNKELPPEYYWQLEHQMLVNPDIDVIYFVVSDGTREKREMLEYRAVQGRDLELIRGWSQFEKDLENYEHEVIPAKPEAEPIDSFPALRVSLVGEVQSSNLPVFRSAALDFINGINTDLQTDQDFANAEEAVKFCDKTEKEIEVVKKAALAQTSSIEELFRSLDDIKEAMRKKRLALSKLVAERKEQIRASLVTKGRTAFQSALDEANKEFHPVRIEVAAPDFSAAIKNKRTLESLRGAVDDELAKAKIALNEKRDHIRESLKIINSYGSEYQFLFADKQQLVDKPHDHLQLLVDKRVDDHKAAEQKRIDELAERKAADQRRKEQEEADRVAAQEREKQRQADAVAQTGIPNSDERKPVRSVPDTEASKPAAEFPKTTTLDIAEVKTRPTDDEIIEVLALHFRVHEFKVIEWIGNIDLERASRKLAGNF